jgi:putative phage-type endonuclease
MMAALPAGLHPAAQALLSREQWAQRTPEWYAVRRGLLTASDAASALDVKPYASYRGSARAELLRKKVENAPLNNMFVAHGQRYEDEARDWAAAALGEVVMDVGLVRHATLPWLAASPDGVTCTGRLLEIKCPLKRAIQPGRVPEHYVPQVQVQMEVCDVDQTIFVQYKPAPLGPGGRAFLDVVVVERDRGWFARHRDALRAFWVEYMAALERHVPPPAPAAGEPPSACLIVDALYAGGDGAAPSCDSRE